MENTEWKTDGVNFGMPVGVDIPWEEPRHVYFGPRDPISGRRLPEPRYSHQDYPAMRYRVLNGTKSQRMVNDKAEDDRVKALGYADSPLAFGIITAPSREQLSSAQEAEDFAELERMEAAAKAPAAKGGK